MAAPLIRELDNYRGYLVRLVRAHAQAPWCAYVMDVQTREEHEFATLDALFQFLRDEAQPPPAPAPKRRARPPGSTDF